MAASTVILNLRGSWPQFSAMRSDANSPQLEKLQIPSRMLFPTALTTARQPLAHACLSLAGLYDNEAIVKAVD